MDIHPTAIIDPSAELAEGVKVGPYAVLNENVTVGSDSEIMAHAVIESNTSIGRDCLISSSSVLGGLPQDTTYGGEDTFLELGNNVTIREFVSVHRGTNSGDGVTRIGDGCYLMAGAHVGHNCQIGRNVMLAVNLTMAGHVVVEDEAFISGMVALHQFVRIGTHAYIGGFSRVSKDVPPYMLAQGVEEFKLFGPNVIGLRRKGFKNEIIIIIREVYKLLFRSEMIMVDALKEAAAQYPEIPEVAVLLDFIQSSERGVTR